LFLNRALALFSPRRGQAESHEVRFPLAIFFPSLRFGQKLPFGLPNGVAHPKRSGRSKREKDESIKAGAKEARVNE